MTKEIRTEVLIKASPKEVWEVLINFKDYPKWNPFIQFIEGDLALGNQLKVKIIPPESKGMIFKPIIIELEESKRLQWLGYFLFKGVFDGTHKFELKDNENGTSTLIHSEVFKGILVPFFGKKFEKNIEQGFRLMNDRLKKIIENPDWV